MARCLLVIAVATLGSTATVAQAPPAMTMSDIQQVWQGRQDKIKTLKMRWNQVRVAAKGSMDSVLPRYQDKGIQAPQPPRDVRQIGESDFTLAEDDRFRSNAQRETWLVGSQSLKRLHETSLFDGKDYLRSRGSLREEEKDQASIQPHSRMLIDVELLELKPIWWYARGAKNPLGKEVLGVYELSGRTVPLRGSACLELTAKTRQGDIEKRLLLSPTDCLPTRYVVTRSGKVMTQLDIEYGKLGGDELVPVKWRYVSNDGAGNMLESLEVTVTACEIGGPIADDTFRLPARPGSLVVDTRSGSERLALVQPDGSVSESVDRHSVNSHEELVQAIDTRARWWWLAGAVACVTAAVVVFLVARRIRRRGRSA